MSWVISGKTDPDFAAYIAAVEQADGQTLEVATRQAIYNFIIGCKSDGIWNAIKASCILAGARTLTGALVPLVGAAPTNVDGLFVSEDYNRKTGLVGDGSTKYLNSNRNSNAQPADNFHLSAYASQGNSNNQALIQDVIGSAAGSSYLLFSTTNYRLRGSGNLTRSAVGTGFIGGSINQTSLQHRATGSTLTSSVTGPAAPTGTIGVFANAAGNFKSTARLAFYSIGESLDLALLDARVTTLINAFDAAI
jgi:hypothetical protein